MKVGDGPVHVISAKADQMFLDITPSEAAGLPRYTGEMELTNHSAGSLTSQAYQKRWLRKEELLADAAEKSFDCRGMAGCAAVSAAAAERCLDAGDGRPFPRHRRRDGNSQVLRVRLE